LRPGPGFPKTFARDPPLICMGRVRLRHCVRAGLLAGLLAGCSHVNFPAAPASERIDQLMAPESFDHELLARAIFQKSNRERAAHGVPALVRQPALDAAADEQASYLVLAMEAQHSNPFPGARTVRERVERAGLQGRLVAENAIWMPVLRPAGSPNRYYTYSGYAALLVSGWMNSPGHRANLLNPAFRLTGCACRLGQAVLAADPRVYATQVFLTASYDDEGTPASAPGP